MGRRRLLRLGIVALAVGVAVVLYRGPGRGVVRGYVGDVAATMLVYAALGLVWRARLATLAIVTLAIAGAIEVGQTAWHATSTAGALILGTTFDPLDLVAYASHKTAARGFDGYKGHIAIDPDSEKVTATTVTAWNVSATERGAMLGWTDMSASISAVLRATASRPGREESGSLVSG